MSTIIFGNPEKNFPEDAQYENGNYLNQCRRCNCTFVGYKGRLFCKVCETENINRRPNPANGAPKPSNYNPVA